MRVYEAKLIYEATVFEVADVALHRPELVYEYMKDVLEVHPMQEVFYVILLNRKESAAWSHCGHNRNRNCRPCPSTRSLPSRDRGRCLKYHLRSQSPERRSGAERSRPARHANAS
jgi:hypothetical protein